MFDEDFLETKKTINNTTNLNKEKNLKENKSYSNNFFNNIEPEMINEHCRKEYNDFLNCKNDKSILKTCEIFNYKLSECLKYTGKVNFK